MASFFNCNSLNRFVLTTVLSTLTVCSALPTSVIGLEINFNFNEVAFMARLERLVDKLVNSEGKSIDRMIDCLVDIKSEIETSYNIR